MDDASPRFRKDLEASATEADGVACVDVRDPNTGTNFRFYDFEYQLALQFNGQPLRDVTVWASETYGVDLTVDGINEFAGRLSELGFLDTGGPAPADTTPAVGTKVADLDNAEAEWMSAEGAKTATFVPDPGMLDSPADLTPVAPPPLLDDEASPSVDVPTDEATPPPDNGKPADAPGVRLFDILSPAANAPAAPNDVPAAAASPAAHATAKPGAAANAPAKPPSTWAVDLEGTLQSPGEAPAPGGARAARGHRPEDAPAARAWQGVAGKRRAAAAPAAPAPPGLPERRQPPAPEAVQMAAFSTEGAAAAAKAKPRTGRVISIIVLLLAIAGIAYGLWSREHSRVPQAVRVRVLSPKPAAVYRWFSGRGTVTDHEGRTLSFDSAGTLAELLPPGTAFVAGDILGRLRGAQPIEALLNRQRARLAFYQQMRDSMRTANNQPELRQAEIKLADKQRLIDEIERQPREAGRARQRTGRGGRDAGQGRHAGQARTRRCCASRGGCCTASSSWTPTRSPIAGKLGFCRVEVVGLGPRASNADVAAPAGTAADAGSPEAQAAPRFVDCTRREAARRTRKQAARHAARQPGAGSRAAAAPRAPALRRRVPRARGRGQRRRRTTGRSGSRPRPAPPSGATSPSPTRPTTCWSATACASATR